MDDTHNYFVDLYRMIAAVIVVFYHSYHLDNIHLYPFGGDIFVEAFFLLTGYFTTFHFKNSHKTKTCGEVLTDSVIYTCKIFKRFIPYIFLRYFQ